MDVRLELLCFPAAVGDVGVPQVCDMLQFFLEKRIIIRGHIGVLVFYFKLCDSQVEYFIVQQYGMDK